MPTHMTPELATGWQREKQLLINLAARSELPAGTLCAPAPAPAGDWGNLSPIESAPLGKHMSETQSNPQVSFWGVLAITVKRRWVAGSFRMKAGDNLPTSTKLPQRALGRRKEDTDGTPVPRTLAFCPSEKR